MDGHLQNGKRSLRINTGKMGKKMENGPKPEMAEKWLPRWKNGPWNGSLAFSRPFSISAAVFQPFQAWAIFHFFPILRDSWAGPVSHSVNGHFHCSTDSKSWSPNFKCFCKVWFCSETLLGLDGPAIRDAANRFAGNPYFHSVRAIRANRLKLRFAIFSAPKRDSLKKGFQFRTLKWFVRIAQFARICELIHVNRAI